MPRSDKWQKLEAVAKGATINITYKLPVGEALEAFRKDILAVIEEARNGKA